MSHQISPNGSAGGCFPAYAIFWWHKPFNLHYFRPLIFFLYFLKVTSFTFPQQALKSLSWVTTSTSLLKSHTGATQALTRVRERCFVCSDSEIVHYYRFSSVFGLWHKANSAHF